MTLPSTKGQVSHPMTSTNGHPRTEYRRGE